ncbi:MAG: hypothetical protein A2X30_07810 [Elusimicrobia bacterium GWB2_63_16]|nr:MAG: hypothetical protein A2X30_07810 [Elusimicrobia bacterium GWB2_63_16]
MNSDKELENVSCGCLLAAALADYAKKRARAAGARKELKFFSEGRERFLLDTLHARHLEDMKKFRARRIVNAAAAILAARFRLENKVAGKRFWTGLAAEFISEYKCGRVFLFEIDWE